MVGLSIRTGGSTSIVVVPPPGGTPPPGGIEHKTLTPTGLAMLFAPNTEDGPPEGDFPTTPPTISTGSGGSAAVSGQGFGIALGTPVITISSGGGINTPTLLGSAFDPSDAPTVTELTVAVTVPAGVTQQALVAGISLRSATTTTEVASVTWTPTGGSVQQLAQQGNVERHTTSGAPAPLGTGTRLTTIWGLLNPVSGAGEIKVTFSAACNSSRISVYSAANVAQFGPVETAQDIAAAAAGPATVTAIPSATDSTFLAVVRFINGGASPFTPSGGSSELFEGEASAAEGTFDNPHGFTDIAKQGGAAGAPVTLTTAASVARSWGVSAIELRRTPEQTAGPGATGQYVTWTNGKLYDPQGNLFVVKGAYVQPNQIDTAAKTDLFKGAWAFNLARINHHNNQSSTTADIAAVKAAINHCRSVGLIAMPRWGGANYPPEPGHTNFIQDIANTYKNDPGVWINIGNEPPGATSFINAGTPPTWITSAINTWIAWCRGAIATIRNTGNKSIIVVPTPIWSQDTLRNPTNSVSASADALPFNERSAVGKYGAQILAGFEIASLQNTYGIIWDVHLYGQTWTSNGAPGDRQAYTAQWIEEMQAAGYCPMFGEFNFKVSNPGSERNIWAIRNIVALRPTYHFHTILWRYTNDATYNANVALVDPGFGGSGGQFINNTTNPTNLTDDDSDTPTWTNNLGRLVWDDNHGN